jgi:putative (di)nucleoside polyphosphate hydrolase
MRDKDRLPYRPCVGIMLLNAAGLAFVGRRADSEGEPEGAGTWWQMPQGGLDKGEKPEAGARRELAEETGVRSARFIGKSRDWLTYDLPSELIGIAWEGRYRGQKQMWFAARFEGEESEINIGPHDGHEAEFEAWRWAKLEELPSLVVPFKRKVYERVVEEFAALARQTDLRARP